MDDYTVNFDWESAQKIASGIRRLRGARQNNPVPTFDDSGPVNWVPFVNKDSTTAPAYGVMRVDTAVTVDGVDVLFNCKQPSTTFTRRYAVNAGVDVPANGGGVCCFEGPALMAFDSGTPALDDCYGPKPGQWTLSKGFPTITVVDGVRNSTDKYLLGSVHVITTLLGKTTGSVTALTGTTSYKIYSGTAGSESDAGFTTVPSAICRVAISSGKWIMLQWINNSWEISPLECPT